MSSPPDAAIEEVRAGLAVGAMIGAFFGSAWLTGWAVLQLQAPLPVIFAVFAAAVAVAVHAVRLRRRMARATGPRGRTPEEARRRSLYGWINVVQWTVVLAGAFVLEHTGHGVWLIPFVIFIVGMHFLPLAWLFRYPVYHVTGWAMMVLAVSYPQVAGPGSSIGPLGAGVILWATVLFSLSPLALRIRPFASLGSSR